jgi:hypothetical protein
VNNRIVTTQQSFNKLIARKWSAVVNAFTRADKANGQAQLRQALFYE